MSRASNLAGFTTSISPPANLSVGIITASSVINVGTGLTLSSGGINITGVITATSFSGNGSGLIGVGLGTTGSINTSGIITASSFSGNGSGLTGVAATTLTIGAGTTALPSISPTGDSNTGIFFPAADTIAFAEGGAEAMRVDSSGRLLVGTSSARSKFNNAASGEDPVVQIEGAGVTAAGFELLSLTANNTNAGAGPSLYFGRSRGAAVGSYTVVSDTDCLGLLAFQGADGTNFVEGASIKAFVDGTPGADDMPGRLVFSTTADGASSPTERMRINQNGNVWVGNPGNARSSGGSELATEGYIYTNVNAGPAAYFNRFTNDGTIVELRQDNVAEGTISVSGTTVSYNGAHLSRWSQLPSGAEREEILRGTVLSNLDEMCEWGEEDNEQLNRMKVSDVEGDKNVSGVFQCWDDDDDTYTNDFYCAMTGDFIIRIADGVTVERGDLLMSAGDGTAKPQDDDIIRSKTVAKVTSTNVTCTYEDGSYCVPCVLMAC